MGRVSDAKERLMVAVLELICSGSYGSTTIDQICEKAAVKKGSFYYFFSSKSDLAVVALEADFQNNKERFDSIFSSTSPPLERIRKLCRDAMQRQAALKEKYGRVVGCPLHSLGAEISTLDPRLSAKIQEIIVHFWKYLETAIRDAHAEGAIYAPDPAGKARMFFAYYEGLLTQARIQNDVGVLRELEEGVMCLLGIAEQAGAA